VTLVRRWLATAVVVPLVVAGCSDDPQPKFDSSPSPSPSESTSAAAEPKAWEVKSEAGAVAFAKHWMDVLSAAMNGGGTSSLRALSAPECELCEDFAQRLDRIRAEGGFYRSSGWRVLHVVPVEDMPNGQGAVALRMFQSAETLRESADSQVVRNSASRGTWSTRMAWRRGEWTLTNLELEQ
jgi:hypothetical protein